MTERYIHIRNFGRFQRFQDRRPTWIRLHLDLVDNDAFLALTDHQQAVLISMWIAYAKSVSRDAEGTFKIARSLPQDSTKLGRRLGRRVRKDTVDSLLSAGFIELLETETVTLGDGSGSLEVKKLDKNYARARETKNRHHDDRERTGKPSRQEQRAEAFVKNAGVQYEPLGFEEELAKFGLDPDEYQRVHDLYDHLRPQALAAQNGAPQDELPWEGEEPPVVA